MRWLLQLQALMALLLGSVLATELFGWLHSWHADLGQPLWHLGIWPLYGPWRIWQWAWWWGWRHPQHFLVPGLVLVGITGGLWTLLLVQRVGVPQHTNAVRWARRADLKEEGLL